MTYYRIRENNGKLSVEPCTALRKGAFPTVRLAAQAFKTLKQDRVVELYSQLTKAGQAIQWADEIIKTSED